MYKVLTRSNESADGTWENIDDTLPETSKKSEKDRDLLYHEATGIYYKVVRQGGILVYKCLWGSSDSGTKCQVTCAQRCNMTRHLLTHVKNEHECYICGKKVNRKDNLVRHIRSKHNVIRVSTDNS